MPAESYGNGLEASAFGATIKAWGNTVVLTIVMLAIGAAILYVMHLGVTRIAESNQVIANQTAQTFVNVERLNAERHTEIVEALRRQSCGLWYTQEERRAIRLRAEEAQRRGSDGKYIFDIYCP